MIGDIRKHLADSLFVPFIIRLGSGHEYPVPTIDHIYLPPGSTRVVVSDDEGLVSILPALHINGLITANGKPNA